MLGWGSGVCSVRWYTDAFECIHVCTCSTSLLHRCLSGVPAFVRCLSWTCHLFSLHVFDAACLHSAQEIKHTSNHIIEACLYLSLAEIVPLCLNSCHSRFSLSARVVLYVVLRVVVIFKYYVWCLVDLLLFYLLLLLLCVCVESFCFCVLHINYVVVFVCLNCYIYIYIYIYIFILFVHCVCMSYVGL